MFALYLALCLWNFSTEDDSLWKELFDLCKKQNQKQTRKQKTPASIATWSETGFFRSALFVDVSTVSLNTMLKYAMGMLLMHISRKTQLVKKQMSWNNQLKF